MMMVSDYDDYVVWADRFYLFCVNRRLYLSAELDILSKLSFTNVIMYSHMCDVLIAESISFHL